MLLLDVLDVSLGSTGSIYYRLLLFKLTSDLCFQILLRYKNPSRMYHVCGNLVSGAFTQESLALLSSFLPF